MSAAEATTGTTKRQIGFVLAVSAVGWVLAYWLNGRVWNALLFDVLELNPGDRVVEALRFFVYDTIKIALLLSGIIFLVTFGRSFLSVERTREMLGGRREGVGNLLAAGLGVVTPFCSCSAVPVFIGFVAAGVPIGVTLSFLIASPLVNEVAIGLLVSMFGLRIALLYIAAGLVVATVAGWVLGRLGVQRWVEPFVFETRLHGEVIDPSAGLTLAQRVRIAAEEVRTILRRIWPYLLLGIGVGAVIHGWAPEAFFTRYAAAGNPFAVLLAVVVGVPLYSNAAGVMPLIEALHDKGLPMGTLLAFMMSVVALSLPELILLRRVLKVPLLVAFVAVVTSGIVAVGYLFNAVLA